MESPICRRWRSTRTSWRYGIWACSDRLPHDQSAGAGGTPAPEKDLSDVPLGPTFAHEEVLQCPSIRVGTPVPVGGHQADRYWPPIERGRAGTELPPAPGATDAAAIGHSSRRCPTSGRAPSNEAPEHPLLMPPRLCAAMAPSPDPRPLSRHLCPTRPTGTRYRPPPPP